jgi:hypothetical protein
VARPRKWETDAERVGHHNKARAGKPKLSRFVAVDGEGTGRDAAHRYVLLGGASDAVTGRTIQADTGELSFGEICEFLYGLYLDNPGAVFAGFFLGYDFTRWLRLLPESKAVRLFDPSLRERLIPDKTTGELYRSPLGPWPVTYAGWEFDILGMRRFKLRPEGKTAWMYICDAGPFFQQSLMAVLDPSQWKEPVVTGEEYAELERGKSRRDTAGLDADMVSYTLLEDRALCRVLSVLDRGFQRAGVRLAKDQWFGPGQAAQAWLDHIHAPTREMACEALSANRPDRNLLDIGRQAYYGGWFEIFAHGIIPGESWEYDINSAYPAVISGLPCLVHGTWSDDSRGVYGDVAAGSRRLVAASVVGSDSVCGAMLHRTEDSGILRPHRTGGWYWESELAAGIRAGVINTVTVHDGVRFTPTGCPADCLAYPFRGVAGLYDERLRVGKNTPEGKAYKLLYNSMYGKFAQSVGEPKYNNWIYASAVTSGCRTAILDAIATHPGRTNALLMVATDGVYFSSRHPSLPLSPALGAWEETVKNNLTLFKPGVHWDDKTRDAIRNGDSPRFKARGINAREFARHLADIDNHYARQTPGRIFTHPTVTFSTSFSMVTPLQALQRGKWETAGEVKSLEVTQDASPWQKRSGPIICGSAGAEHGAGIWRSQPYASPTQVGDTETSSPYPKDITTRLIDPDRYGINDDGRVQDTWRL